MVIKLETIEGRRKHASCGIIIRGYTIRNMLIDDKRMR